MSLKIERVGDKVNTKLHNLEQTKDFAQLFARVVKAGDRISLIGDMGAGKTEFTRYLLRALANNPKLDVPSPTFSIVQTYNTDDFIIHHFDLWRLESPDELLELGWEESNRDVLLVEWPDKGGDFMDNADWVIDIKVVGEDSRSLTLSALDKTRLEEDFSSKVYLRDYT